MADEYVVRIVLDGVDNASDDIKKVDRNVEELGSTMSVTDGQLLMFAGGTAAVAAGLNQMTGGVRKSLSAMRDLGYISDETFEKWNDNILKVEVFTGILESLAAVLLFGTMMIWLWNKAATSAFVRTAVAGARAIRPLGIVFAGTTGMVVAMTVALLALLVIIIFYRDDLKAFVGRIRELGEKFNFANRAIKGASDALHGWVDAVRKAGDTGTSGAEGRIKEAQWGAGGPSGGTSGGLGQTHHVTRIV